VTLPVAILAGGRATRLGDAAAERPKALLEVAGEPFVHHQLRLLREHGVERVVVLIGHLGDQIVEAVGDGARFGLRITYSEDPPELAGTAGALRGALGELGERFLVLYGDTYLRIDYAAVADRFLRSGALGLMTVLRNRGEWDASNTAVSSGRVVRHDKRHPAPDMEWIDYGLGALRAEALTQEPEADDLSDVYGRLAEAGELVAFEATERFYEIGTPAALAEADEFLRGLTR
jgi:NDP-sugar pyrophosphorylase family protein